MIERSILFNAEMVKAILDGRKTQTRRVVKLWESPDGWGNYHSDGADDWEFVHLGEDGDPYPDGGSVVRRCSYGVSGDRLWVRETFQYQRAEDGLGLHYRADGARCGVSEQYLDDPDSEGAALVRADVVPDGRWKPSIHMPRWASRITLEVTGVRVERVQDIRDPGILAEGVLRGDSLVDRTGLTRGEDLCDQFRVLWDSINAKKGFGWEANPWVWVVEFKLIALETT